MEVSIFYLDDGSLLAWKKQTSLPGTASITRIQNIQNADNYFETYTQ